MLRRTLGELQGAQLVRFLRTHLAGARRSGRRGLGRGVGAVRPRRASRTRWSRSLAAGAAGALGLRVVLLGGAKVLRIREVTSLVDTVAARLRRG